MTKYVPASPASVEQNATEYAYREFQAIADFTESPTLDGITFTVLHVEPSKPRVGLAVYADGSDWNPGSGEGLYVYESTGWKILD